MNVTVTMAMILPMQRSAQSISVCEYICVCVPLKLWMFGWCLCVYVCMWLTSLCVWCLCCLFNWLFHTITLEWLQIYDDNNCYPKVLHTEERDLEESRCSARKTLRRLVGALASALNLRRDMLTMFLRIKADQWLADCWIVCRRSLGPKLITCYR